MPEAPTPRQCNGQLSAHEWNNTHAAILDVCVHELFEQQVARNPDAVAVTCKNRKLSYRELNDRANQVAHYLRKLGVGSEILVGVCLGRSLEMVIALLGVWKAGGAYVPLDPASPEDRVSFIVRDSGMKVLLTDEKYRHLFSLDFEKVVHFESEWPIISQESTANFASADVPSSLAYVMYTSGSTGQPKGVMIEHRSLVNYLCWAIKAYKVEGNGPVPIHSSIAFDSTVASLYPPLLSGGQIELLPEDVGAQNLLAALRQVKNRSKVVITPAHLELLSQQLSQAEMAGMTNVLVIAGEALLAEKLSKWRDHAPETSLFNEYGPTETTVGCCAYEVQAEDSRSGPVPIGGPIANAQLYVLDDSLRPVSPGVIGELHIGGAGVARGYLGKPELTRERFLADPFSTTAGARLYKTGDLVRHRKDGNLEFLGRADDQVKVRGYRIELGEIEATLAAHPGVRSCTVLAREGLAGNKQLVAFVISRESESVDAPSLKKFLKQKLPDYMVPGHIIFLSSFPLNHNGKIDRKSLLNLPFNDAPAGQKFVAPRTKTEKILTGVWREMLEEKRIGVYDNFFELGGDSLLAMKVLLRIRERFGIELTLRTFFSGATIADLAHAIETDGRSSDSWIDSAAIEQNGNEPLFFWIGADARAKSLSDNIAPNHEVFIVGFETLLVDQPTATHRMEEIARELVLAIRKKQVQGPYRLGGFCLGGVVAYEVARQLTMLEQEVELLVLIEQFNYCSSAKVRFATGLRRTIIRANFHFGELRRLERSDFPIYVRRRWRSIKSSITDLYWRFSSRFRMLERQFRTPDLERILYVAACSYEPKQLGCPTVIFRCKDYSIQSAGDPYFGWRDLFTGRSEVDEVPGDHLGMFQEPNVQVLAEKLRAQLQKANQSRSLVKI